MYFWYQPFAGQHVVRFIFGPLLSSWTRQFFLFANTSSDITKKFTLYHEFICLRDADRGQRHAMILAAAYD